MASCYYWYLIALRDVFLLSDRFSAVILLALNWPAFGLKPKLRRPKSEIIFPGNGILRLYSCEGDTNLLFTELLLSALIKFSCSFSSVFSYDIYSLSCYIIRLFACLTRSR
jgi:hypothetical protein